MPDKKLPISEFAAKIKSKYPQYGNLSDTDLVTKITNTYPKYKDMVDLSGISKKKELSEPVSPVGGETGISVPPSGFEELKPAKRQPTEVIKEPKVVGEDTLLARKMERAQRPAVATTEVKLPAAPKVVAEEKAAERALAPKLEPRVAKDEQGWLANTVSALDRGFYKNLIGNPIKGLATVVQYGTEAMTGGRVKEGPVSDALNKFGDWFNNAIDEVAPQDPEFKNSLSDQFAQALGQVGSIVLTGGFGAGGRATGIATQAVPSAGRLAPAVAAGKELVSEITSPAAISAGLTMGQAEFDRAKKAGASDDQAFEAFYKNAAVGSILEKIPVMQFLKRFNNATAGGVANYIKTKGVAGITGGLEEATTEVLQQVYANKTAKDIYNTNQDIFEGLTESGGIGFGVGFLLNAMGANAKLLRKQGKEAEAQLVDAQIKEFESRAEKGPEVPPAPAVAPEMTQYTMEAPRLAGEPEQISKPIELSIEPQVPATEEKTYRVEYFDPESRKMTHQMFATEAEGEAFKKTLTREQASQGVTSYFEKAPAKGVGEVAPKAAPEVPAAPEIEKKSDADIEKRMQEIEESAGGIPSFQTESGKEYDFLEKEMEKREKASVFNVTLDKVNEAVDALIKKEKEMPNGYGAFIEMKDARETKSVANRYLNASELTESEIYKDFADAVMGNPDTWYADGLKLRESLKEASNRGIDTQKMVDRIVQEFVRDGFTEEEAKGVVARRLAPIFEGSQVAPPELPAAPEEIEEINAQDLRKNPNIKLDFTIGYPESFVSLGTDRETIARENNIDASSIRVGDEVVLNNKKYVVKSFPFPEKVSLIQIDENGKLLRNRDLKKEEIALEPEGEELPFGEVAPREQKKQREITNRTKRALNIEITDNPIGEVLQYFLGGGKVNPDSMDELFGRKKQGYRWEGNEDKVKQERKLRRQLLDKNALSIEALAEKIAGTDRLDQTQDYRNAIEEVLLSHNRRETMADELVDSFDTEYAEKMRQEELEELGKAAEEEAKYITSLVPEAQREEIAKVLDRFRKADGRVDWSEMERELEGGFEPILLELSEQSQKFINDAIEQIKSTGRISGVPIETVPSAEAKGRAGDAARALAQKIRAGKINKEGFRASTGFDVVWDAALEVVAASLEAGASVADAVQDGLKYIRTTDWYKGLANKKEFEDKFSNRLNEEYNAIQEPAAGEVPVQPKARAGEKVEAGVPPTRPPKAPKEEGEAEGRKEERRFSKTLINSPELLKAVKKGVGATLEYTRQANAMSVAQAQEILDVLGEDKAYNAMKDEQTNGAVRTVLGQVLIKRYNELAKKATSKEDKDLYIEATIDIADYVTKKLATDAGQTIQAFKLWQALTPEAQLLAAVKEVKKSARANVGKVRKDIDNLGKKFNKANEEAIKEILKSEEVDRSVKKDAQEGVQKAKDRAAKARQKRADIIKKYKGKGGITLTTGGLTKEGIEFVGEVAVTYIEEGLAEVQVIAEKILADIKTIIGSSPNDKVKQEVFEIAEKELSKSDLKIVKSVKDQRLKINEIAIKHFTEAEKIKKNLAQKFMDEADMSESNAEALAKRFEDAFDRVVSRKKAEILAKSKKRFDRIQKAINEQAGKKAENKTLQDEIIKYSNLGAFKADDMLDYLAKKFNLGQLTTEQAAKIEELAQKIQKAPEGTPKREATEDLLAYQANLNKGNWGEVAQAIWYANILSGYRTHEKNIVSTFFNSLAELGTEIIADPKSAPYLIAGYVEGFRKRGLLEAGRTLATGRSPIHVSKIETPEPLERIKFIRGGYNPANWFKYVGRAMKAEDVLSFQGLKEARAWQLARKEAEKYGFNTWTKSGWKKVNELLMNTTERFEIARDQALEEGLVENSRDYKRRIYELMENSRPEAMTEDAYNFAAHGTYNYMSDGTLGAFTNAISNALDVKIGGVQPGRFVVPFTRIITNVVNNALDYSPVGVIRAAKGARGFKSFDEFSLTKGSYKPLTPEQRRIVAIKAAVGISFAAIIQYMVSAGLIDMSGEGPEDEKKKAQLREQGWQPYSIKIGDTWYSYFYTPLVLTLGWMGNLNDAAKYGEEDEQTLLRRASIASLKFGGMIADMTWINSAATFLGALNEPKINEQQRRVENALSGMARGFVPFAQNITQLTQAYNSTFQIPAKQVNNSWEALYQDIPIVRNSLNDKVNALGEPVIKDIDIMWSKEKGSPVWSFLTNKNGWVATLNRKTVLVFDQKLRQDRPLTDDEFYELSKLRGRYIKEDIERIMKEGYPVKREGAIKIVLGEDMTPKELNNILSKRIEPLATKKAKAKIFGFEYSEKEADELNAELTELEREYWGLNEN